jgi:hypothetical protein
MHPNSLSCSRIEISGAEARLVTRCQILSLEEVVPGLDADGDGAVDDDEIASMANAIFAYVGAHYTLAFPGGPVLVPQPIRVTPVARAGATRGQARTTADFLAGNGAVDIELAFLAPRSIDALAIEATFFHDTSPDHVDLLTLERDGSILASFGLDRLTPSAAWIDDERVAPINSERFAGGLRRVLAGWDPVAMLIALVLGARSLRLALGAVSAFAATSIAVITLVGLGIVHPWSNMGLVSMAMAITVAYAGADALVHPRAGHARWIGAAIFGVLHGTGLARPLGGEPVAPAALLAYVGGVIAAIALIAGGTLAVLWMLPGRREIDPRRPAPELARIIGAIAITVAGLVLFAQRI